MQQQLRPVQDTSEETRKFRDPELRKDVQPSTKVGLMSRGACHTFPSFCSNVDLLHRIPGIPWRPNSDELVAAMACAFSVSFFFLPTQEIAHCRQQCPKSLILPRVQGVTASPESFLLGYDPITHACEARPLTDVGWLSLSVSLSLSLSRIRLRTEATVALGTHRLNPIACKRMSDFVSERSVRCCGLSL